MPDPSLFPYPQSKRKAKGLGLDWVADEKFIKGPTPLRDDDMPTAAGLRRERVERAEFGDMDDDDLPLAMEGGEEEGEREGREEEAPRINVDIPRCVAQLGTEVYFVKLPNFLSVETRSVISLVL